MAFSSITSAMNKIVNNYTDVNLICDDVLAGLKTLDDNSVDLTVTSPPYNVGIAYDSHDDNMATEKFWEWLKCVWSEVYRVTKPNGRICVDGPITASNKFWILDCYETMKSCGWQFMTAITWSKTNITARTAWGSYASPSSPYCNNPEELIVVASKGDRTNPADGREPIITPKEFVNYTTGMWTDIHPESATRLGHPAPFPVELPKRCIKLFTYRGGIVLDPFNGSGSTGVAAMQCGCKYIGIDISQDYIDLSRKRIYAELIKI